MATSTLNPVIDQLRRAVLLPDGAGLTDGQLLESFISQKDEAAFEVLVRRHGPMVLGVCRRILRDHHDAEDAFQAEPHGRQKSKPCNKASDGVRSVPVRPGPF
jgi:hypothetical protein